MLETIASDVPERLHERIAKTDAKQVTELELSKEAAWICRQSGERYRGNEMVWTDYRLVCSSMILPGGHCAFSA